MILLYHGITASKSKGIENYSKKHLPADQFREQMKFVAANSVPVSMDQVVNSYNSKTPLPKRAVAITFDDGFQNNYSVAAPILREFNIPATFYITSGIVNTNLMFWVDQLEDCLNLTQQNEINVKLQQHQKFPLKTHDERLEALIKIKSHCKVVSQSEKDRIINDVIDATGIAPDTSHANNYQKITWSQLRELNKDPNFIIGGHSLYHDILSSSTETSMQLDIGLSIGLLERNLKTKIEHYSYPEGQLHHFNEEVIEALKTNGIKCSPSAVHGVNPPQTSLFYLKRVMVGFMGIPFPQFG